MRVRIKKLPRAGEFDEFDLHRLQPGDVYEMTNQMGMLLLVGGYAEVVPLLFERPQAADKPPRVPRTPKKAK